jgi:hypothetical protein
MLTSSSRALNDSLKIACLSQISLCLLWRSQQVTIRPETRVSCVRQFARDEDSVDLKFGSKQIT